MTAIRDAPYRVCHHVVRPAGPGLRWELTGPDPDAEIIECANLCGWAAFARRVPDDTPD
jgi:hypothetical protein